MWLSLPCSEIDGWDWRLLPSVSLRDGQKVNSWAPSEVREHWLGSADAKSAPTTTSVDAWISFTEKRTSKVNWIIFIERPKSMQLDVHWQPRVYLPQSLSSWSNLAEYTGVCWFWTTEYFNLKSTIEQVVWSYVVPSVSCSAKNWYYIVAKRPFFVRMTSDAVLITIIL